MFMSRVRLDLNRLVRDDLLRVLAGEAYTGHQLLWQLFDDVADRRPFLFRQEIEDEQVPGSQPRGLPVFYVLSDRAPAADRDWLDVQTKPFKPQLAAGDRLGFVLRANPTIARTQSGSTRSQRSDVMMHAKYGFAPADRRSTACKQAMDEAAAEWLTQRGGSGGFTLPVEPQIDAYRQHQIKKRNSGDDVRFSTVDYSGLLQIADETRFLAALAAGFGRAKAFGCGLMLVRPVSSV